MTVKYVLGAAPAVLLAALSICAAPMNPPERIVTRRIDGCYRITSPNVVGNGGAQMQANTDVAAMICRKIGLWALVMDNYVNSVYTEGSPSIAFRCFSPNGLNGYNHTPCSNLSSRIN